MPMCGQNYNFVEPSSFVCKLLLQHVCDGRETWIYYSAPHGECHKGVGRRGLVAPEKSATRIPTLTKIDAMFCAFADEEFEIPGMLLLCVHSVVAMTTGYIYI